MCDCTLQIRWATAVPNVGSNINSLNYRATFNQCCIKFAQLTLFVSPELSSGTDLVIQMSVRRPPSVFFFFLSGAYLGNPMTYLDDIWYVGGARSEVAHAEFWAWQMPNLPNLCKNLSGAFLGNRMPHLNDIWYVGRARVP